MKYFFVTLLFILSCQPYYSVTIDISNSDFLNMSKDKDFSDKLSLRIKSMGSDTIEISLDSERDYFRFRRLLTKYLEESENEDFQNYGTKHYYNLYEVVNDGRKSLILLENLYLPKMPWYTDEISFEDFGKILYHRHILFNNYSSDEIELISDFLSVTNLNYDVFPFSSLNFDEIAKLFFDEDGFYIEDNFYEKAFLTSNSVFSESKILNNGYLRLSDIFSYHLKVYCFQKGLLVWNKSSGLFGRSGWGISLETRFLSH